MEGSVTWEGTGLLEDMQVDRLAKENWSRLEELGEKKRSEKLFAVQQGGLFG